MFSQRVSPAQHNVFQLHRQQQSSIPSQLEASLFEDVYHPKSSNDNSSKGE